MMASLDISPTWIRLAAILSSAAVAVLAVPACTHRSTDKVVSSREIDARARFDGAWLPLRIGTFPVLEGAVPPEVLHANVAALRTKLPAASASSPLPTEVSTLLARAAESLRRGDASGALETSEEARRLSPDRVEPLELQLLAQLSIGDRAAVRATLGAIVALDPSNAIGLAFEGLNAAQAGRVTEALGFLAHFVGDDAVLARGASIPLPTAPGELEEVAACCALRLGYAEVAFAALDAAARQRIGDESSLRRLALLRADCLAMLGNSDQALLVLERLEQPDRDT
ncbi:MAG: tetratricopeptide repeat protein, partial [bacterium]